MADSWDALMQTAIGDQQSYLKRHLLRMFEASRLVHLRPGNVRLSCDPTLRVTVTHPAKSAVMLRIVAEADGSGWIDCEALEPEFHIDFDRADHAFAVEVAALILHGWATVRTERRSDGELMVSVDVQSPDGDSVWCEFYETRTGTEGSRTVTWASSREPRALPPAL